MNKLFQRINGLAHWPYNTAVKVAYNGIGWLVNLKPLNDFEEVISYWILAIVWALVFIINGKK